ncbi:hypothetical protein DID77_02495, partial [Candidatus Marinamargulisbacteria bacterium SCGC AG-439-L15]
AGLTGATFHILADAIMTLCLFMAVGCIIYKTKNQTLNGIKGAFKKMPLTLVAFLVGAFSMIGIPPTCGFFSKWYLLSAAIQSSHWEFFVGLLFSSFVNAILFFRIIEIGFFQKTDHDESVVIDEAPVTMLIPLILAAILVVGIGLYSNTIIERVVLPFIPGGFL